MLIINKGSITKAKHFSSVLGGGKRDGGYFPVLKRKRLCDSDVHLAEIKTFAQKLDGDDDPNSGMGQEKIKDCFALCKHSWNLDYVKGRNADGKGCSVGL